MTTDQMQFSEAEQNVLRSHNEQLSDDEFQAFLDAARRYKLNPLANQIYAQVRWNKDKKTGKHYKRVNYVTGIDGYRLVADRTEQYAGNDDPIFDNEDSPSKASVTVYKLVGGQRCPFTATARWDQYYPGDQLGFMWKKMPHLMLGKCAEALALRKAFPAELSGIYTAEEMQQADKPEGENGESNQQNGANKRRPFEASQAQGAETVPDQPQNDPKIADPREAWQMFARAGREKGWPDEDTKVRLNTWLGEVEANGISDTTIPQRQRFLAFLRGECESPVEQTQEQAA